ncbi:hypothetical protein NDU88_003375 [Pleurodeles waltl]|uniref:Myb/SANT-like DNA-binding domain-containing protein n=1 Tax=Pleurodeles waltl TaxID=8319 RepID=A0AAV7UY95_PLEWA|nr:hypothetical protein NDU88_003375 [Pleurodeles waltl]
MSRVTGERAPAFTSAELERLVDGVLPQYRMLYGPPDQQVSAHQKKGMWSAIAKDLRTLGVYGRWSTHCRKQWEDLRRWARKMAEAQLGMASQQGRGACRTLTPLMARILAVAYPELDGRLGHHNSHKGSFIDVRRRYSSVPLIHHGRTSCRCTNGLGMIQQNQYACWLIGDHLRTLYQELIFL